MTRGRRRRGGGQAGTGSRRRAVDLDRYRAFIPDWSAFVETANRPEPTVFRVRTGRVDETVLEDRLRASGFSLARVDGQPDFRTVVDGPVPVSLTLEHWLGLLYVQQASTGVAAPALGAVPGDRVLDLCAAPGGKTMHVADGMRDRGCVVACEISEPRIRGLLGNVYRHAHTNVLVIAGDGRELPEEARFDRVLVDAPCSGEGTLRRRAGSPPDPSPSFLGFVTSAQRALLEKAVRVTRPGGTILYVTCTFAPEENEAVVDEALRTLPVELEPLDLPVRHAPGLTSFEGQRFDPRLEGAARIYPQHFDSGGLFLARLRKLDDGAGGGREDGCSGGWAPVPASFPDAEVAGEAGGGKEGDGAGAGTEDGRLAEALSEMRVRYGMGEALDRASWIERGGRAWLHTADAWPLESWSPGSWRPISLGLRSIEWDTRGRPRPTNDFLRWAGAAEGALPLARSEVLSLLRGEAVPTVVEQRGPVAFALDGDVLGRGAVTSRGLVSEIPRARGRDLLRILEG